MRSQQRATPARNGKRVRNPTPHVPSEYRQWVKGRVVNLSTATKYYKKIWDVYRKFTSSHVKEHGQHQYELDKTFFRDFSSDLQQADKTRKSRIVRGVNLVASALCDAAKSFAPAKYDEEGAIEMASLYDGPLWPQDDSPSEDVFSVWGKSSVAPPISDAWLRLGKLPVPTLDSVTFHESSPGQFALGIGYDDPLIRITPRYSTDKNSLPKLTIEIEGEPVCLLIKGSQRPQTQDFDQAKRLRAICAAHVNALTWG